PRVGRADRAASVTRGGLQPYALERFITQNLAVRYAVKCDTAREAQVLFARFRGDRPRELEHDLFCHDLNRSCEIHLALREARFRRASRSSKGLVKARVCHPQTRAVIEIVEIQAETAIVLDVDQV